MERDSSERFLSCQLWYVFFYRGLSRHEKAIVRKYFSEYRSFLKRPRVQLIRHMAALLWQLLQPVWWFVMLAIAWILWQCGGCGDSCVVWLGRNVVPGLGTGPTASPWPPLCLSWLCDSSFSTSAPSQLSIIAAYWHSKTWTLNKHSILGDVACMPWVDLGRLSLKLTQLKMNR